MSDSKVLDFGTKELARHARLVIEPRNVSKGGNVIDTGRRNLIPDLLEILYVEGYLKGYFEDETDADRRVIDGRSLQAMREIFASKGKDFAGTTAVYKLPVTLEGHIGSDQDIAQTVYNEILFMMGRSGGIVERVCVWGELKDSFRDIRAALDALPSAIEGAEARIKDRIKNPSRSPYVSREK